MRVLLIAGGWSSEREISLRGAEQIHAALVERGHEVHMLDLLSDFASLLTIARQYDIAFINLHGSPGEDGLVQALLESIDCPYQGSKPRGSFLALHKAAARQIFQEHRLLSPKGLLVPKKPEADWVPALQFPLFVKPNTGGSSLYTGKVQNMDELRALMDIIFAQQGEPLLEEAIEGVDVTCGVLEELTPHGLEVHALPPVLISPPKGSFFDYNSKYAPEDQGGATEICPAPLPPELLQRIQNDAIHAHRVLGLSGYSRADFILRDDGVLFLLEVNTLPGMTAASLVPKEAAAIGMSFGQLLEHLLTLGLARHKPRHAH